MTDLISRQAAIDALGERPAVWMDSDYEIAQRNQWDIDKLAIETVPTADVRENVRGILKYEQLYHWHRCSICKKVYPDVLMEHFNNCQYQPCFNFCPNCGADMRGGEQG